MQVARPRSLTDWQESERVLTNEEVLELGGGNFYNAIVQSALMGGQIG